MPTLAPKVYFSNYLSSFATPLWPLLFSSLVFNAGSDENEPGLAPCVAFSSAVWSAVRPGHLTILEDVMGPKEIIAESGGKYPKRPIGIDTISNVEKLSNPASTLTSAAIVGMIRSHSANSSVDNSVASKSSLSRIAKASRGACL